MEEAEAREVPTVGERLRTAREKKKLSLEQIASQTRIPRRHLESLETGDWDRLPAPTYTIGFAKSYAAAVGLDRAEIGDQLRSEMGTYRPETQPTEVFQPADPARTMPKWLVFAAIAAVVLLVLIFTWFQNRSLEEPEALPNAAAPPATAAPAAAIGQQQQQQQQAAAGGPVILTATEPAWIHITDQGRTLFQGVLNTSQTYQVPPTATAPLLRAGKPEALRITVGGTATPPVGEAGRVASNVSLRGADLMNQGQPAAAGAGAGTAPNQGAAAPNQAATPPQAAQ